MESQEASSTPYVHKTRHGTIEYVKSTTSGGPRFHLKPHPSKKAAADAAAKAEEASQDEAGTGAESKPVAPLVLFKRSSAKLVNALRLAQQQVYLATCSGGMGLDGKPIASNTKVFREVISSSALESFMPSELILEVTSYEGYLYIKLVKYVLIRSADEIPTNGASQGDDWAKYLRPTSRDDGRWHPCRGQYMFSDEDSLEDIARFFYQCTTPSAKSLMAAHLAGLQVGGSTTEPATSAEDDGLEAGGGEKEREDS